MDSFTINDLLPSKYLKQSDIEGEVVVTITAVKLMNIARDDEAADVKPLLQFAEFSKPLVCNKTNTKRLFKILGAPTSKWIGKSVILYVDENVEYAGEMTGGLRIKAVPQAQRPTTKKVAVVESDGEMFENDIPID